MHVPHWDGSNTKHIEQGATNDTERFNDFAFLRLSPELICVLKAFLVGLKGEAYTRRGL